VPHQLGRHPPEILGKGRVGVHDPEVGVAGGDDAVGSFLDDGRQKLTFTDASLARGHVASSEVLIDVAVWGTRSTPTRSAWLASSTA